MFFTTNSSVNARLHHYEARVDPFDLPIRTYALLDNARAYINYMSQRRVLSIPPSLYLCLSFSVYTPLFLIYDEKISYQIYQKHNGKPVGW